MRVLTLQQRLRLMIIILFVIALAITVLVVYPTVRSIIALQAEVNATEAFLEEQYERSLSRKTRTVDLDAFVSTTTAFTQLTVDPTTELALIQQFEELAAIHEISQQLQIRFSNAVDKQTKLPYFEFSFNNNGALEGHMAYLHDLATLPYIVDIGSIDMRASNRKNTTEIGAVTMRFSAKIYVQ